MFESIFHMGNIAPIDIWLVFQVVLIVSLLFHGAFLGSHSFPYQSLLLSTTILNDVAAMHDIVQYVLYHG